ncbi:unnamed protein product [Phyllotreta striolata]|uniref:RecQ-mediated genome instability protein 1 n=1 Tax=Phyllotreta striolata TaxID=444603 RepID=A0A9N9TQV4_PHYSR|nr:unnamed protein product [Phyllotreta striolata]
MDEATNVENFFKSNHVHLSSQWLEGCIKWCKEENLPSNYTLRDLQLKIFEQWLLLDLRDVQVPCLPTNLSTYKKYILSNSYILQLMQVVDISKPKYWQLQRIRNGVPENLDQDVESSKRMLQLTLTDGVQEIEAMEYKPIKCLSINLSPGVKIKLIGPIQIRRGMVMLEERHVHIVGGEVDTLKIENCAENILAKSLNQPLNENPKGIEENILIDNSNNNETNISSTIPRTNTQNTSTNRTNNSSSIVKENITKPVNIANEFDDDFFDDIDEFTETIPRTNTQNASINRTNNSSSIVKENITKPVNIVNEFDDDFFEDIDELTEIENEIQQLRKQNVPNTTQVCSKSPELFDDTDIDFESIEIPNIPPKPPKEQPITNLFNQPRDTFNSNSSNARNINTSTEYFSKSNINENTDNRFGINCFQSPQIYNERSNANKGVSTIGNNHVLWKIDRLSKTIPSITEDTVKIKAKFKSVVEKLSVTDDEFRLVIEVEDDSGTLVAKLHNDVIVELAGITAESYSEKIATSQEFPQEIIQVLDSLRSGLTSLDNILQVLIVRKTVPVIVKILRL